MNTESELIVEQISIGPMQNFAYLLGSRSTREVVIVDPAWDIGALLERVDVQGYTLTGALVTHYHPDHIGGSFCSNTVAGLPELLELNPVRIYANKLEADGVKKVTGYRIRISSVSSQVTRSRLVRLKLSSCIPRVTRLGPSVSA